MPDQILSSPLPATVPPDPVSALSLDEHANWMLNPPPVDFFGLPHSTGWDASYNPLQDPSLSSDSPLSLHSPHLDSIFDCPSPGDPLAQPAPGSPASPGDVGRELSPSLGATDVAGASQNATPSAEETGEPEKRRYRFVPGKVSIRKKACVPEAVPDHLKGGTPAERPTRATKKRAVGSTSGTRPVAGAGGGPDAEIVRTLEDRVRVLEALLVACAPAIPESPPLSLVAPSSPSPPPPASVPLALSSLRTPTHFSNLPAVGIFGSHQSYHPDHLTLAVSRIRLNDGDPRIFSNQGCIDGSPSVPLDPVPAPAPERKRSEEGVLSDTALTNELLELFFRLSSRLVEEPSVAAVQGLILLGDSACTQGHLTAKVLLNQMALTMAQCISLDVDPENDLTLSWFEKEERRRTWFAVIAADRINSAYTGRGATTMSGNVRPPISDAAWELWDGLGVAPVLVGPRGDVTFGQISLALWDVTIEILSYNREQIYGPKPPPPDGATFPALESMLADVAALFPDSVHATNTAKTFSRSLSSLTSPPCTAAAINMYHKSALCMLHRPRMLRALSKGPGDDPIEAARLCRSVVEAQEAANGLSRVLEALVNDGKISDISQCHVMGLFEAALVHLMTSAAAPYPDPRRRQYLEVILSVTKEKGRFSIPNLGTSAVLEGLLSGPVADEVEWDSFGAGAEPSGIAWWGSGEGAAVDEADLLSILEMRP
ncbi:hypothetical protein BDK51DRAFT_52436 [Blyttiomyces helicus]|uniref:Xylanolytic transcriptional activator regulatory domain-containing protein n=1 Tax=Blyttiomyces helicus TaxID=388810 RepID=A0A4P9WDS1_9FUNG|nr:hypothetical protein BDK51DRAFT_52436 [Blyttiomyces helicus]|eukprot:RKO89378.1 hypothetical protein BDK51DRAFT_52436 [Blyttiomyces helicus]